MNAPATEFILVDRILRLFVDGYTRCFVGCNSLSGAVDFKTPKHSLHKPSDKKNKKKIQAFWFDVALNILAVYLKFVCK